jgi:hypothetical protein
VKDFFSPTIRRICGLDVPVQAFEKLAYPMTRRGKPETTIEEAVHPSVLARYAADRPPYFDLGRGGPKLYRPRNLANLVGEDGVPIPALPIAEP